jgi:predicted nucleic acid-binding protein
VGFLIDTCIWIDVEQGRLGPGDVAAFTGDAPVYLSPVTLAELRLGIEMTADPGVRQKRLATFRRMTRKPLLPIDADTADVFGELAGLLARGGVRAHRTRDRTCGSPARRSSMASAWSLATRRTSPKSRVSSWCASNNPAADQRPISGRSASAQRGLISSSLTGRRSGRKRFTGSSAG